VIQTLAIVGLIFFFRRSGVEKIGFHQVFLALAGYVMYLFLVFQGKSLSNYTMQTF